MDDIKSYVNEQLEKSLDNMIKEKFEPDSIDTTGMIMKPWDGSYVIVGRMIETEPLDINTDNGSLKI